LTKVATVATFLSMKAVGIKVLKNNLSRYLRDVRAGETVLVTDRDEVIAEIHRPTVSLVGRVSRWESWLNERERSGRLRRGRGVPPRWGALMEGGVSGVAVDAAALLAESREDRT
jgi:antitoxin (DNA-binding transcriptional repressor) of toxin-antitoxin stability system